MRRSHLVSSQHAAPPSTDRITYYGPASKSMLTAKLGPVVIRLLCITNKFLTFKTYVVWFSEAPFDIDGASGVTFMSCPKRVDLPGFSRKEQSTIVFNLDMSEDGLWRNLGKTSRQRIRKAEKEGVRIRINKGHEEFIKLNDRFRKLKGLPPHSVTSDYMERYGILFSAFLNDEILAGCFNLSDGQNMRGMIGATARLEVAPERRSMVSNANRMLEWEMIKYARAKAMDTYDLGGYYTGELPDPEKSNINVFKDSFGGKLVTRYDYRKDYSPVLKGVRTAMKALDMA